MLKLQLNLGTAETGTRLHGGCRDTRGALLDQYRAHIVAKRKEKNAALGPLRTYLEALRATPARSG